MLIPLALFSPLCEKYGFSSASASSHIKAEFPLLRVLPLLAPLPSGRHHTSALINDVKYLFGSKARLAAQHPCAAAMPRNGAIN